MLSGTGAWRQAAPQYRPHNHRLFILPFESHFIVYKADVRAVTIIRILHQRMNITAHLR